MTDEAIVRLFYERSEQAIAALAEKHGSAAAAVAMSAPAASVSGPAALIARLPRTSRA